MRGLQVTLFVLAVVSLSAQTLHFSYKKYVRHTGSVMDTAADKRIRKAATLDELKKEYDKVQAEIKELEKNKSRTELRYYYSKHPYSTRNKLNYAIRNWEMSKEQLRKLYFHWTGGLLLFLLGAVLYWRKQAWQGMAFVSAGVMEMVWWSSPTFTTRGALAGYADTLDTKLILTLVTLALILLAWNLRKKLDT